MDIHPLEQLFNLRYNIVYYVVAFIALFFVCEFYLKNKNTTKIQNLLLPILLIILVFLIGFRSEFVGKDTPNNIKYFTQKVQVAEVGDLKDVGLYLVSAVSAIFTKNVDVFLIILAFLYILPIYIGIRNLKIRNVFIFFFFIFSFFFFKTMGTNTQRQGLAFTVFFCSVTYFINDKKKISYLLFVIAFMFHASIILPIVAFLVSSKIKKLTIPLIVYGVATGLSIINFKIYDILAGIPIVSLLVEERLDTYTDLSVDNYRVGFRPDFWVFNTVFLIIGYYTYKHLKKNKINKVFYQTVFISYILLSSFFFLMFSARFSDRFGFLAWMFIPFLLLPYVDNRKSIGVFNPITISFICLFLATIFKFI